MESVMHKSHMVTWQKHKHTRAHMNEDTRDVETEENMVTVVLGGDYERMAL